MQTKTILLVDDEHSIREGLSKLLSAEGYEVLLAVDGQEAIADYGASHIDLLLLDLNLPVKDGWAALKCLSDVNPTSPVIIITGRSNQRTLAEQAGADALMEKPLDVPLLLQTMRDLLDEPRENGAQRAARRVPGLRLGASESGLDQESLLRRATTPYPCPERTWRGSSAA